MKKEYMKPVMEAEAFVANEYVAACWLVTCDRLGDDHINVTIKNKDSAKDAMASIDGVHTGGSKSSFHRTIYNENSNDFYHHYIWFDGNRLDLDSSCKVSAIKATAENNNGHPNASN